MISFRENTGLRPLLHQSQLARGGFAQMLERLNVHSLKGWLLRAMVHCSGSYHQPTVESQLGAAYQALEALTFGYSSHKGTGRVLSQECNAGFFAEAESFVNNFCGTRGLDRDVREQLVANIQGLGRRSLKRNILGLVSDTGIGTDDLWPEGTKLAEGIRDLAERRNKFIHEALVELPPWGLAKDLERIRAIVERSILALLGWDWSQVSPFAYTHEWLRTEI